MKPKRIQYVLRNKFNEWVESIKSEEVRNLVEKNTIITGGAIASMLMDKPINDFDIYFRDLATLRAVTEYYVDLFKQNPPVRFKNSKAPIKIQTLKDPEMPEGKRIRVVIQSAGAANEKGNTAYQYFEQLDIDHPDTNEFVEQVTTALQNYKQNKIQTKELYKPVFITSNAISLSGDIQLVTRFYGNADTIHSNFDFAHCTCYWTSLDSQLNLPAKALECLLTRDLHYQGSKYPIASMIRTRKFISRGFSINAGQYLKMAFQVNRLNLDDPEVLEDQLIGVDTVYFMALITAMKQKMAEEETTSISAEYVCSLIDKIF